MTSNDPILLIGVFTTWELADDAVSYLLSVPDRQFTRHYLIEEAELIGEIPEREGL